MLAARRRLPDIRLLVCLSIGIAVYLPTVRGEFVWDDLVFLGRWVGNTDTFWQIFFPPPGVIGTQFYYRPITQGFATLLWSLFGEDDPTFWHVAIIGVHVVTIGFVFVLLRDWWLAPADPAERTDENRRTREWGALAGAAFYACWPANSESVAWISSRADTLLGPFIVGAVILHLRARDRGARPVGAAVLFFCSLLVKETGIVFLPMAIACSVLLPRGDVSPEPAPASRAYDPGRFWALPLWLPHVLAYFLYAWMRKRSMGSGTGLTEIAVAMLRSLRPRLVLDAWGFYVQEALSLGSAAPFLQYPPHSIAVVVFGALGLLAFAIATALLLRKRAWPIALAAAWFVLPLGPPLATVSKPLSQNSVTVHYLYIPNVALAALLGLLVVRALRDGRLFAYRSWLVAAGLAASAACGVVTHRHYQPWMTSTGLWERAVADNPHACLPRENLGVSYWDADATDRALVHLRIAAWTCKPADSPERHGALVALSQFYLMLGDYPRARTALHESRELMGSEFMLSRGMELEAALALSERVSESQRNGNLEFSIRRNDLRRALATLEDAARVDKYAAEPRIFLGLLYLSVGERPRSLKAYRDALTVSSSAAARRVATRQIAKIEAEMAAEADPVRRAYERGQTAEIEGRRDDALAAYREALVAAPERSDLMLAIADILASKGDFHGASEHAEQAAAANPKSAVAWLNLGVYRGLLGDAVRAEDAFAHAEDLAPGWLKACVNHGRSLETLGRPADAVGVYERCRKAVSVTDLDARPILDAELRRAQAARAAHEARTP